MRCLILCTEVVEDSEMGGKEAQLCCLCPDYADQATMQEEVSLRSSTCETRNGGDGSRALVGELASKHGCQGCDRALAGITKFIRFVESCLVPHDYLIRILIL